MEYAFFWVCTVCKQCEGDLFSHSQCIAFSSPLLENNEVPRRLRTRILSSFCLIENNVLVFQLLGMTLSALRPPHGLAGSLLLLRRDALRFQSDCELECFESCSGVWKCPGVDLHCYWNAVRFVCMHTKHFPQEAAMTCVINAFTYEGTVMFNTQTLTLFSHQKHHDC